MKKVLSIAGSDCSGGAGIQADIKTITVHNMYAMSVITALTSQNTKAVYGVKKVDIDFVESQLDSIFTDIMPDSIKIGMLVDSDIIKSVSKKLKHYGAKNIVLDPVMVSTTGSKLLDEKAKNSLIEELFPLVEVITPNISEAEELTNIKIINEEDMIVAAKKISKFYDGSILIKGGHLKEYAIDILYCDGKINRFKSPMLDNKNTHGTGCTLSSAIACNLASGYSVKKSVALAKEYINKVIAYNLDIGHGNGPLNHMADLF